MPRTCTTPGLLWNTRAVARLVHLKQYSHLEPRTAMKIVQPMLYLEALDYAPGQGTIHRDLKPANLMIDTLESTFKLRIMAFLDRDRRWVRLERKCNRDKLLSGNLLLHGARADSRGGRHRQL